jgi:ketosteroid isomerase-like protein
VDHPRTHRERTRLENLYTAIVVVRDDRIHAVREYTDTLHAKNVLFS